MTLYRRFGKRLLDLIICVPALILGAPLLLLLSLLVRMKLGSPVLFRQQRPGLHGRPFFMRKFRSMTDARDAEARGRAAGMSLLADRCPTIWDVEPSAEDNELARLHLCAILASVALGPVLPDDGSTLFGVRGAMERVQRLLAG